MFAAGNAFPGVGSNAVKENEHAAVRRLIQRVVNWNASRVIGLTSCSQEGGRRNRTRKRTVPGHHNGACGNSRPRKRRRQPRVP